MYEFSKEYLERLIKESGVKLGGAKASAMVAIIELLDANALDGLLASIRRDFSALQDATKNLSILEMNERGAKYRVAQLERCISSLTEQKRQLETQIELLKDEEQTARFDADFRGCREEERSRLLAYEAAIMIGKNAFGDDVSSDVMEQIIRSASNVAAGFVPVSTIKAEETIDNQTSRRRSIL